MIDDEYEGPAATARKPIPLITKSIANGNETNKSLALMNSGAGRDFQLRLALLKLGNDQPLSQDYERLSRTRPLLEVDPHQRLQAAPARIPCGEADSPEPSLIRLPQTSRELGAVAQKISDFRKASSSQQHDVQLDLEDDPVSTNNHPRMTTQEASHVDNADEREEGQKERHGAKCQSSYEQSEADEFMSQVDEFYRREIRPIEGKKAIKVAVLDTGVDQGEIHFRAMEGSGRTSLKDVKSFIEGDTHDVDGHGTRVAALVVRIAPHAHLYIAKVCERKEIGRVDQYVKAIKWAMELKVHIINISAAIDYSERIHEAISEAEGKGIIVFAAASNDGANKPRAFPASMDKVLAIHATDKYGNPSGMNPSPVRHCANISTRGESIPSPLEEGGLLPPGTSFATPIAAGMAANILTLVEARLNASEDDKILCRLAFKREGMKQIFLAASGPRLGYDYVCPDGVAGNRDWFIKALKK